MPMLTIVIAFLALFAPPAGGFELPFSGSAEKEAQAYVDKVAPEIVTAWDETILARYAHQEFYAKVTRDQVAELFFSFRMLGGMQKYKGAKGEVVESKSSTGPKYTVGKFLAEADFEKGPASIFVTIVHEEKGWSILGFQVHSDVFTAKKNEKGGAPPEDASSLSQEEMEKTVAAFLKEDVVGARRDVEKIYRIARRYAGEGNRQKAMELYEKALLTDPANLGRQMDFAKLLLPEGKKERAAGMLRSILDLAEDEALLVEAESLLASLGEPLPPQLSSEGEEARAEILLVPLGKPDMRILHALRPKLQDKMGMTVVVAGRGLPLPAAPDRFYRDRYVAKLYQEINPKLSAMQRDTILGALNFQEKALADPGNQGRFLLKFFTLAGIEGEMMRRGYESALKQMGEEGQYDIGQLAASLRKAFPFDGGAGSLKVCLGVTEKDLFMGEGNYLFGGTNGAYGAISYYQFLSAHNGEKDNRPRLVSRLLKQALSSANFALGIPRCATPYCARSFPSSVAEHDAKGEDLCGECRRQLDAYKSAPRANTSSSEFFNLGEKYSKEGKYAEATSSYLKAIEHHDQYAMAGYFGMAKAHGAAGQFAAADAAFRKHLDLAGKSGAAGTRGTAAFEIGKYWTGLQRYEEAIGYLTEANEEDASNAAVMVHLAEAHANVGNKEKAEALYRQALATEPEGFLTNLGMANFYSGEKKTAEAIAHYEKAFANMPPDAEEVRMLQARYNAGECYLQRGDTAKAQEQMLAAIARNATFSLAHRALGRIYGGQGKLDEAVAALKKAGELKPDNAEIWNDLGYTYYLKKDYHEAITQFEKSLSLDAGAGLCHYNKALAHFALKEFDLALRHADAAAERKYPGSPQFHQALMPYRNQKK